MILTPKWFLAYDFTYLRTIHGHMNNMALAPRIRTKHSTAWHLIRKRHKLLLDTLEASDFDPNSICQIDWTDPMKRVGTPQGFFG